MNRKFGRCGAFGRAVVLLLGSGIGVAYAEGEGKPACTTFGAIEFCPNWVETTAGRVTVAGDVLRSTFAAPTLETKLTPESRQPVALETGAETFVISSGSGRWRCARRPFAIDGPRHDSWSRAWCAPVPLGTR